MNETSRHETTWANALIPSDVILTDESWQVVHGSEGGEWVTREDGTRTRLIRVWAGRRTYLFDAHDKVTRLSREWNFASFPVIADEALETYCDSVDDYARTLTMDADDYVSMEDSESASFIGELTDMDKLTFHLLDSLARSRTYLWREGYVYDPAFVWEWNVGDDMGDGWAEANFAIVNITSNGVVFLETYPTRGAYEYAMDGWRKAEAEFYTDEDEDEDEDEDDVPPNPYAGPGGLLDEVRQAERQLGSE